MKKNKKLSDYIQDLQSQGRLSFTFEEAKKYLNLGNGALKASLGRLTGKGAVRSVRRGFYTIIPPEYRSKGNLPAEQYVDHLMQYIGKPYYIGLLSAAALHGASHQKPQKFYIITQKPPRRAIRSNNISIQFHVRSKFPVDGIIQGKTNTGYFKYSNKELTALDLIFYDKAIGGIVRAASIISDLFEEEQNLHITDDLANSFPISCVQRLGYLLDEIIQDKNLADGVYPLVEKRGLLNVLIDTSRSRTKHKNDNRWKVTDNIGLGDYL
jgi:predicted transcriptional regulator of viral defense system